MTNEKFNTDNLEPKIYVICAAAHEAGHLHGAWIKANQSVDEIYTEIRRMLEKSPVNGEDYWILHDYNGFGDICLENKNLQTISDIARFIYQYGFEWIRPQKGHLNQLTD